MIGRLALWAVLAVLAVVVIVVQTDRQAYRDPSAIALTPAFARVIAQQRQSELVLATMSADEDGLAGARQLVRWRPVPAENLLLYAQTAQLAGAGTQVLAPLEVAAARGWRAPVLQVMAGQAALAGGDHAAAANRVAALLATGGAPQEANRLLTSLMQVPEGRAELSALLERPGHYSRDIWRRYSEAGTPAQVLDVARGAVARQVPLDCQALQAVAGGWERLGFAEEATALRATGCPASG